MAADAGRKRYVTAFETNKKPDAFRSKREVRLHLTRFDSKKIEKAAVLAVKNLIQQCKTIDDKINEDDKDVLVDGTLDLYSSDDLRKANLVDKVYVQVKGKTGKLKRNKRGFYKYGIEVEDLKKYRDVFHGVLFFCVAIGTNCNVPIGRAVYYAQLLPYDINRIQQNATPSQKTAEVRFRPFPTEPREIERLVRQFHHDAEKQNKAEVTGYGFLDETTELPPDIKSWSFTVRMFSDEEMTSLPLLAEGPYIYGESRSGQLSVIGKMNDVSAFGIGKEVLVASGDHNCATTVFSGCSLEGEFLEFENIRLFPSKDRVKVNYAIRGGFRQRYNTAFFVRELQRTGKLHIDGNLVLSLTIDQGNEEQIEWLEGSLKAYGRIVETLDTLNIKADWDPEDLTEKELRDIEFMHRLLVEKKRYRGKDLASCLIHFDIQETQVFVFARKMEDGDGYELLDLNSRTLCFAFGTEADNEGTPSNMSDPVPPFAALRKESLKYAANLDSHELEFAFDRLPITSGNHIPLNGCLLEMLAAYDDGCAFPSEVLDCAMVLARRLCDYDGSSSTYLLNLMQTIRRKRSFTEEEISTLKDVAIDSENLYDKAAAFALLGDTDMATRYYSRCSKAERHQIDSYPISIFFKENAD